MRLSTYIFMFTTKYCIFVAYTTKYMMDRCYMMWYSQVRTTHSYNIALKEVIFMEKNTTLQCRISKEDRDAFQQICQKVGVSVSVALGMMVKTAIRNKKLPIRLDDNDD